MYNTHFYIICGILTFGFLFEIFLKYLNLKNLKTEIPNVLKDVYPQEKLSKAIDYTKTNIKFSFFSSTISFLITITLLFTGFFGYLDNFTHQIAKNEFWGSMLYFLFLIVLATIFSLPFSYYRNFVIEEKFGFNNMSIKTFFSDAIKGLIISILLGGLILSIIIYLYLHLGKRFWYYSFAIIIAYSAFWQMFYVNLIVPLFNKMSPLPEGELKEKIKNLARKVNFKIKNINLIDASKRSKKANAYFSGLGPKKNIILFDSLTEQLTPDEITAVLAHETGHYKKKHTTFMFFISLILIALELYFFTFFIGNNEMAAALGAKKATFEIILTGFFFVFEPISTLLSIFANYLSRKFEFQADNFAAENFDAKHLISALKKLHSESLANPLPHKFYVFIHYSHPPLKERLKNLWHKI